MADQMHLTGIQLFDEDGQVIDMPADREIISITVPEFRIEMRKLTQRVR